MVILDANMILRYLLKDNEEMQEVAKAYLIAGNVAVTIEVMAEVVYVLRKVYGVEPKAVADLLIDFLELVECRDCDVLILALNTYAVHNLDFVDCVLYAYNKICGFEIATFDKKLLRLINSEVI